MSAPLVVFERVARTYRNGPVAVEALRACDLVVEAGEHVAVTGPSGSGKSTFLHVIGCLDRPTSGTYRFDGRDVTSLSDRELAAVRNRAIGFVFQRFHLLRDETAQRNVELPLLLTKLNGAERRRSVMTALSVVGLADRMKHYPRQLSGGQEQRVGIARAIVTDPTLLLCDEPTGDLDRKAGDEILNLLQALNREQGKTIIMVTHDPHAADRATRTLHLEKGQLVREVAA